MALEKRMGHTQSGGPILDVFGQVVGIATIRGFPSSYEEGAVTPAISTAKINAFLQHNKVVIAGVNPGKTLTQNEIGTKVMPALIAIVGIR